MYLSGAIVQKVERPAPDAVLLTLRLPGETVYLLVITGAIGAIGAIERPRHLPADAFIQRLRRAMEGGRVVGVFPPEDGQRVVVRRGEERCALVASRGGVTFLDHVDAIDEREGLEDGAALSAAAEHALARHLARLREARRAALRAAVDAARRKLRRRLEAVEGDLAKIGRADEWQTLATLLVTNQHVVRRGASSVTIDDWSTGEAVPTTIPLDPGKSAKENAEALFHRARRLKKGRAIAEARRVETDRALAQLDRIAEGAAAPDADLDVIEARAKAAGVRPGPARPTGRRRGEPEERRPYTEYLSGERVIYVGRGAKDNDALTTKIARPNDLWLHAKGWTGAHVIVPLTRNESCPPDLLVDAAHLAAHFSDARGEASVEVQYTPRKYVRKPKGSAPGAVVVDREKVMVLRVEPARLDRLLRSQNPPG
ncbi:MAG: DUF814 domain-containing protein [Deltaproteobacteria bacterium]|nr:DUF814 domain-containing protein [Deltaproteobacteria bacterium]